MRDRGLPSQNRADSYCLEPERACQQALPITSLYQSFAEEHPESMRNVLYCMLSRLPPLSNFTSSQRSDPRSAIVVSRLGPFTGPACPPCLHHQPIIRMQINQAFLCSVRTRGIEKRHIISAGLHPLFLPPPSPSARHDYIPEPRAGGYLGEETSIGLVCSLQ